MVTGVVYLCVSTMGMDGPINAIKLLRDFYQRAEQRASPDQIKSLTAEDDNQTKQSKEYIGLKLIWFLRLFIEGKKFPRGSYPPNETPVLVNLLLHFLTQAQNDVYLATLMEIDPIQTFQLFQLFFDPHSIQHDFLQERSNKTVSHESLFICLMNFSMMRSADSTVRACF